MDATYKKRLVVGLSGASGSILGIELLKALRANPAWETHLVLTRGAEATLPLETGFTAEEVRALADFSYPIDAVGEAVASGTFEAEGMVVIPCSMKTLAGIASGYSENLLLRAADVAIKEGRKLVLVPRESPLSPIHLRNLLALAKLGVFILPPVVPYYAGPKTVVEANLQIVGRVLDKFGAAPEGFARWDGRRPG